MNRFVRGAAAVALLAGGLGSVGCTGSGGAVARGTAPDNCGAGGCGGAGRNGHGRMPGDGAIYPTLLDVCYPQRYNAAAPGQTPEPFRQAGNNRNVKNQNGWDFTFEPG